MTALPDHRPAQPLAPDQIEALRAWPTPAIANAIETFAVRSRATGFMSAKVAGRFPELGVMAGYAVTARIRASIPPEDDPETVPREAWVDHLLTVPAPRIVVIQDMDQPPVGSYWGEVNATRHQAMGCLGVITDGGVRDLDEMRSMGFNALSAAVLVSHAYVHMVDVGGPVTVGGLTVHSGDLLAADQHGAIHIPHDIAPEVAAAAKRVEDEERAIIAFYRRPEYRPGDRDGGRYP
ncbi:MAG: RraA family protein [Dehalococcoidia bacterium]